MRFTPPLTMMDFFRRSEGIWFTQRAVHHFDVVADESGESNLFVTVVGPDDPRIRAVCEQQGVDPAMALGGASFSWQDNLDDREPNPNYAAILVDIGQPGSRKGKLLRNQGYVEKIPVVSRYSFSDEGVLTIDTEYATSQGQERAWFVTEDFRVRVSTVRMMSGVNLMTYCSERRCVLPAKLQQMSQHNHSRNLIAGEPVATN